MLTKTSKVTYNKSGNGSKSGRITVPADFLKLLNISEGERSIRLIYDQDEKKIIIEKDFGYFYYPTEEKDTIDAGCKWGIIEREGKELKLVYTSDEFLLGFENEEDLKLYKEDLEELEWNKLDKKGEYK